MSDDQAAAAEAPRAELTGAEFFIHELEQEQEAYLAGLYEKIGDDSDTLTVKDLDFGRYDCLFDGIIEHTPDGESNNLLLSLLADALALEDVETPHGALPLMLCVTQLESFRKIVLMQREGLVELPDYGSEIDGMAPGKKLLVITGTTRDDFLIAQTPIMKSEGRLNLESYTFTPDNEFAGSVETTLEASTVSVKDQYVARGDIQINFDRDAMLHSFEGLMTLAQINFRLGHHPKLRMLNRNEVYGDNEAGYVFSHPESTALSLRAYFDLNKGTINLGYYAFGQDDEGIIIEQLSNTYELMSNYLVPIASDCLHIMDPENDTRYGIELSETDSTGEGLTDDERAVEALKNKRVKGLYAASKSIPESVTLDELYGIDEKIERILDAVDDADFVEEYQEQDVDQPKVIVLAGESGSGKTTMGHALANTLKVDDFLRITEGMIRSSSQTGEPLANTEACFKLVNGLAAEGKKVLWMLDEADSLLGAKSFGDELNTSIERMNNGIINAIKNGIPDLHPNVILVINTNHLTAVDPEILAPHRVALIEMFEKPTEEVVRRIIEGRIDRHNEKAKEENIFDEGIPEAIAHYAHKQALNPSAVKSALVNCVRRRIRRSTRLGGAEVPKITLRDVLIEVDVMRERFKLIGDVQKMTTAATAGLNSVDEDAMAQEERWRRYLGEEFWPLLEQ